MKKRRTAQDGFFNVRVLIAIITCAGAACSLVSGTLPATAGKLGFFRSEALANSSHRTLTFGERVAYQRAIEEVYWRHRIWPKENPGTKPPLEAVVSQRQIERKVENYLRNSQVLQDYWQRPITAEQLQVEMERMAQHTKKPEVLRELFEALGNDPFVIAECLARPALVERDLATAASRTPSLEVLRAKVEIKIAYVPSANYTLPTMSDGAACSDDTWTATSTTNAPSARSGHTAVWTGSEMIVWGGGASGPTYLNTGGRYNPSTDSWTATSTTNAPVGRQGCTAVWTGSEMIVWGGLAGAYLNTGGRYNPTMDSWTATSTTNAPQGRYEHTAIWTGSEMIVWGGFIGGIPLSNGGRYNPGTDSWTATSTTNVPPPRGYHTAVWTSSEMIIWGGWNDQDFLNTGGSYNPGMDSWTATSTTNAPTGRFQHTAVLTDSEMIVWGGWNGVNVFNTGGRYNPSTNSWTATSTTNAPTARYVHTTVWTSGEMIVWGGYSGSYFNTGGRYCAQSGSPTPTPTATATPTPTATPAPRP